MKLGKGNTRIQLCDNSGIEVYVYDLDGTVLSDLVQVYHPERTDTEGIEEMDNGDCKKIVAGKRIKIIIPIKIAENITAAGWETFLYRIWDWEYKIKITPYLDETAYTFWVILEEGRQSNRDIRNLRELDMLKFVGAELVDTVS